jgi:NADH-quinone oxidoreductase subunit D
MDRFDYTTMMANEHAYVLAVEKLLGIEAPIRAQYLRVMFDEITRVLSHVFALAAHGLDLGAMTIFLYCFREREDLLDVYEAASGRSHARRVLQARRRLSRSTQSHAAVHREPISHRGRRTRDQ